MIVQGPDIERAADLRRARCWRRSGRSTASSTSTRTSSRRSRSCGSPSIAQRAADLGVVDRFAGVDDLRTLVGGEEVSKFKDGDEQFSVRLRLDEPFRNNPATMGDLLRAGGRRPDGPRQRRRAPRRSAARPASIDRYNRQRQISVNANLDG